MRLTTFTDYSLRVLIYLAVKNDEHPTIREISESFGISRNHLMKVVQQLSQKGYLIALRGKNGGLRLNMPPADIGIGVLIRDMENDLELAECFGKNNQCIIVPACELQAVFTEALQAFFKALDAYNLEDILRGSRRAELVKIFNND
jgi:Rrf2 family transcriptional regulator, nitric oxide-sensitive transcriptional repressor